MYLLYGIVVALVFGWATWRVVTIFFTKPLEVYRVIDGDTIEVAVPRKGLVRVRLRDIDAPEADQPGGYDATITLKNLLSVYDNKVTLDIATTDHYGRWVAVVYVRDILWKHDIQEDMVEFGLAWVTNARSKVLKKLEKQARDKRKGVWADKDAVPPWVWRGRELNP